MKVIEVSMENFESEVKNSDKPVVVDFYADWCGPCKMMAPLFHELAEEMDNVKFAKCNVDNNPALSMEYQVQTIPNIVIMKSGEALGRVIGFTSKEELKESINNAI